MLSKVICLPFHKYGSLFFCQIKYKHKPSTIWNETLDILLDKCAYTTGEYSINVNPCFKMLGLK